RSQMLLGSNTFARSIAWNGITTALSLTGIGTSASYRRVQVCRSRWPAKREFGAICLWQVKSGAAPATVGGEPFSKVPLGFGVQSLGRRRRAKTREPGDLPERVILPACGARARSGLPL